jgi:hypothetical protein
MMDSIATLPPERMTEAELIVALRACESFLRDFKQYAFADLLHTMRVQRRAAELRTELESRFTSACI